MIKGVIVTFEKPGQKSFVFFCPGCKTNHSIQFDGTIDPQWGFNSNVKSPTVTPSIRVDWGGGKKCHSYVKNGNIQFLGDCSHKLAGTTVELPEYK